MVQQPGSRPTPLPSQRKIGSFVPLDQRVDEFWREYKRAILPEGEGGKWRDGATKIEIWISLADRFPEEWDGKAASTGKHNPQWKTAGDHFIKLQPIASERLLEILQEVNPLGGGAQIDFFSTRGEGKRLDRFYLTFPPVEDEMKRDVAYAERAFGILEEERQEAKHERQKLLQVNENLVATMQKDAQERLKQENEALKARIDNEYKIEDRKMDLTAQITQAFLAQFGQPKGTDPEDLADAIADALEQAGIGGAAEPDPWGMGGAAGGGLPPGMQMMMQMNQQQQAQMQMMMQQSQDFMQMMITQGQIQAKQSTDMLLGLLQSQQNQQKPQMDPMMQALMTRAIDRAFASGDPQKSLADQLKELQALSGVVQSFAGGQQQNPLWNIIGKGVEGFFSSPGGSEFAQKFIANNPGNQQQNTTPPQDRALPDAAQPAQRQLNPAHDTQMHQQQQQPAHSEPRAHPSQQQQQQQPQQQESAVSADNQRQIAELLQVVSHSIENEVPAADFVTQWLEQLGEDQKEQIRTMYRMGMSFAIIIPQQPNVPLACTSFAGKEWIREADALIRQALGG